MSTRSKRNYLSLSRIIITLLILQSMMVGSVYAAINSVDITAPDGGEVWGGTQTIAWDVSTDGDGEPAGTEYDIAYSPDNGSSFVNIEQGIPRGDRSYSWDTSSYEASTNALIRIRVFLSGFYQGIEDFSASIFTLDNTPPTIESITLKDNDADGNIDRATIVFNESMEDSSFTASDFEIDGIAASSIESGAADDETIDVIVSGVTGTDVKDVTYTQGTATDIAGNLLADINSGDITEVDEAAPVILSASTVDADDNGVLDGYNVTFSEDVDDSTFDSTDLSIGMESTFGYDTSDSADDDQLIITFDEAASDTGDTPDITTSSAGLFDDLATTPNEMAQIGSGDITETDGAEPIILGATASDQTNDYDTIDNDDTVSITFSEDTNQPPITNANIDTVLDLGGNSWLDTAGDIATAVWSDDTLQITLSDPNADQTSDTNDPTVEVSDTITPSSAITDAAGNEMGSSSFTIDGDFDDTTSPTILSATTNDTDANGQIDEVVLVFDESMDSSVTSTAGLSIGSYTIGGTGTYSTTTYTDDTFTVTLTESGTTDTDATPDVTYAQASGSLQDDSNAANDLQDVGSGDIAEDDGAAPILMNATTASTTSVDVVFSESVSSGTVDSADFSSNLGSVSGASTSGDTVTLTVASMDTDATPDITYTPGSLADTDGNTAPTDTVTAADGVAPELVSAITGDSSSGNSLEDTKLLVTFSEDLDGTTIAVADFDVDGYTVNSESEVSAGVVELTLTTSLDTDATPDVSIVGGIDDLSDNEISSGSVTPSDGLAPQLSSAQTTATDTIEVTFTEDVDDSTVSVGDFDVTSPAKTITNVAVSNDVVTLTLQTPINTDDTPDVTHVNAQTIDDLLGNTLTSSGESVTSTDGVAPTFNVTYDNDSPVPAGALVLSVVPSEDLNAAPTLSIDQQGTTDITDVTTNGCGSPYTSCSYSYTVQTDDASNFVDGEASVTVSGTDTASNTATDVTPDVGATFTIDTIDPTISSVVTNSSYVNDDDTLVLTITASDTNDINVTVDFSSIDSSAGVVEATDNMDGTYTATHTMVSGQADNPYSVDVTATDEAGNSALDSTLTIEVDNTNPSVTVDDPNGGEYLAGGDTFDINWDVDDTNIQTNPLTLEYFDGADWVEIDSGVANSDPYTWTVPALDIATANIRITAIDLADNTNLDTSDADFTIDSTDPVVSVVSPNGGELLAGGSTVDINWTATDANMATSPITIEYYDGSSWSTIASSEANDGGFSWTVPSDDTTTARIRITAVDLAGNNATDTSDADFTVDSTDPEITNIVSDSFYYKEGDEVEVNVTASDSTGVSVDVDFGNIDTAGGEISAADNSDGTYTATRTIDTSAADGNYTIPVTVTDGSGNDVSDTSHRVVMDNTNATVSLTSLDGGQFVQGGSVETITWTASDTNIEDNPITLEYYDGSSWSTIASGEANDGSYDWTVPSDDTSSAMIKISVVDKAGNVGADQSTTTFTVDSTDPTVSVTSPNGGESLSGGDLFEITWTASDTNIEDNPITLEYYDGSSWSTIASSEANDGSYDWTVPSDDTTTAQIRITVDDKAGNSASDTSDTDFTIDSTDPEVDLSSPNGDEFLAGGDSFEITWTASDDHITATPITIEYYDGSSWSTIASSEVNDGSYDWTVPSDDTGDAVIKITAVDEAGNNATDESDSTFTIDSTLPTITVDDPVGGEVFGGGDSFDIQYSADDDNIADNPITLEYFDGSVWQTITSGEDNFGTYTWTIPEIDTDAGKIRVTVIDESGNSNQNVSEGTFTIDSTPPTITDIENVTQGQIGERVNISAVVQDSASGLDVSTILLHYDNGVEETVLMVNDSADVFNATIPNQSVAGEVTYFITASDNVGNDVTSDTFTITYRDLVLELEDSEWNLVSVPETLEDDSKETLFDDTTVWEYDATVPQWVAPSTIEPGKGYWVRQMDDVGVDYANTTESEGQPGFDLASVTFYQGWNLAGHMCDQEQEVEEAFPSAIYNNLFVVRYEESTENFEIYATQGSIQEFTEVVPGEGYWIFLPSGELEYTNVC